jgi:hypothetical protein
MTKTKFLLKRADKINLQISGLTHAGDGVGRYYGKLIFHLQAVCWWTGI